MVLRNKVKGERHTFRGDDLFFDLHTKVKKNEGLRFVFYHEGSKENEKRFERERKETS